MNVVASTKRRRRLQVGKEQRVRGLGILRVLALLRLVDVMREARNWRKARQITLEDFVLVALLIRLQQLRSLNEKRGATC